MNNQALIIGGTTGMGRATAELLVKDGVEVIIIGRDTPNLTKAENELSSLGIAKAVALDLNDVVAVNDFSSKL